MPGSDDTDKYLHKLEKKICGKLRKSNKEKESLKRLLGCLRDERRKNANPETTTKERSVNEFLVKREPINSFHPCEPGECEVIAEVKTVEIEPKEANKKVRLINKHIARNESVEKRNQFEASKANKKLEELKIKEKMGINNQDEVENVNNSDTLEDSRHKSDVERFCSSSERMKIFESFCKQKKAEGNPDTPRNDKFPAFKTNKNYTSSYSDSGNNKEKRESYQEEHFRENCSWRSSWRGYQTYPEDKQERHEHNKVNKVRNMQKNEGVRNTRVSPSSSSVPSIQSPEHRMIADVEEQLQNSRRLSGEEDGELIEEDDDIDDILTGCRRANWNTW